MTPLLLALLVALPGGAAAGAAPGPRATLPDAATQRYRVEIGGSAVGVATLAVACERSRCTATFETAFRLPEAGGGGVARRTVRAVTDREGNLLQAEVAGRRRGAGGDAVASILAETLLAATPGDGRRCLAVEDVESGRRGEACAERRDGWLEGVVLGEPVRLRGRPGALPGEVVLPAQGTRFLADPTAGVPERAPGGFGAVVPSFPGAGGERDLRFCGLAPEPEDPRPPPAGLPRDFPERGGCQERSMAYLREAAAEGLPGRLVVGVAWDGERFVWHEWVELAAGGWVAVDPSFGQLPAQGPRFAVARFTMGDEAGRAAAGRRVLACWGRARVERSGGAP